MSLCDEGRMLIYLLYRYRVLPFHAPAPHLSLSLVMTTILKKIEQKWEQKRGLVRGAKCTGPCFPVFLLGDSVPETNLEDVVLCGLRSFFGRCGS